MTLGRSEVLDLLARHELRPSRALGQNFVVDANTVRRVARLSGVGPGQRVVEVGAGLGSLTLALADTGAEVTAIEVDARLVAVLRSLAEPAGVRVVEADAMTLDWTALLANRAVPMERTLWPSYRPEFGSHVQVTVPPADTPKPPAGPSKPKPGLPGKGNPPG